MTEGAPVLYCWTEYGIALRIIQFGGRKLVQSKRGNSWKPLRAISDNEYNAAFRDLAEAWQKGHPTDWDLEEE